MTSYYQYKSNFENTTLIYKENQNLQEIIFNQALIGIFTLELEYKINNYWLTSIKENEFNLNPYFITKNDDINNFQTNNIKIIVENGNTTKEECIYPNCKCQTDENSTLLCEFNKLNNAKNFHIFMISNLFCEINIFLSYGFLIPTIVIGSIIASLLLLWTCIFCCCWSTDSFKIRDIPSVCAVSCKTFLSCLTLGGLCGCGGRMDCHDGAWQCICCCKKHESNV